MIRTGALFLTRRDGDCVPRGLGALETLECGPVFRVPHASMPPSRRLLPAVLLVATAMAAAQQPAPPVAPPRPLLSPAPVADAPPTRQQKAEQARRDAEIATAAQQVVAMVDEGRIGEVWDGASATVRRIVPRAEFVAQVTADRKRLGAPLSRGDAAIHRERYAAGGQVPQGEYLNVATATRFANAPQPVRELVSFRLDEDRVWRVSGYSVR